MKNEVAALKNLSGLTQPACGPLTIYWLTPNAKIPESEIESLLSEAEHQRAQELKAPVRRAEFQRSRWLLRQITGYRLPLPPSPAGAPSWPPGFTGSLTHKEGYVGLALAQTSQFLSIGIDAESLDRVRAEFANRVCCGAEPQLLKALARKSSIDHSAWLAVIFSFKEALFKCHYPLGQKMFYFQDAEITSIDPDSGAIAAQVLTDTSPITKAGSKVQGHFIWQSDGAKRFVLTSCHELPKS